MQTERVAFVLGVRDCVSPQSGGVAAAIVASMQQRVGVPQWSDEKQANEVSPSGQLPLLLQAIPGQQRVAEPVQSKSFGSEGQIT